MRTCLVLATVFLVPRWPVRRAERADRFLSAPELRISRVAKRVALFRDADASNDPTVIGVGSEACAACHTR